MNRRREIVVTVTYNELGIIIDANAEPRKQGQWVLDNLNDGNGIVYHCTCCNWLTNHNQYAYCPNCGAEMRGEQHDCH